MKQLILLVTALLAVATSAKADVEINSTNFPDANFRNYLLSQSYGKDGILSDAEIANITELSVSVMGIQSLRGIKYFTALKALFIQRNMINENEMEHLVRELPVQSGATLFAYYFGATDEYNYMNYLQASAAQAKGWSVLMWQYAGDGMANLLPLLQYPPNIVAAYITPDYFPDENFRNALKEKGIGNFYATPYITFEDVDNTKELDVSQKDIASLTGIQYFTALEVLNCSQNKLTSLDVSKNTALNDLNCSYNLLTSLDVSKNTALNGLDCFDNKITSLDVSKNTALNYLNCTYNLLTSLDLSKNTALKLLYCAYNLLTSLDLSKNTALLYFNCSSNQLTALDLSKNRNLLSVECFFNQINGINMDNLIASLPQNFTDEEYPFYVVFYDEAEGNVCTKQQAKAVANRGWTAYGVNSEGDCYKLYDGSDSKKGDVNDDGAVDVADISTIIDVMAKGTNDPVADVNDDGAVDVADISEVIDIMAGKGSDIQACPDSNHPHWIDLGLPSGTKWMCCNVGAACPEEFGGYFNFEEAQAYSLPLQYQMEELINYTTSEWTTLNGVEGRKFTGSNGCSVFIPAAGYVGDDGWLFDCMFGYCWSSTPFDEKFAFILYFDSNYASSTDSYERSVCISVRPVRQY